MFVGFMNQSRLPALADIVAASKRIEGVATKTPLVESPSLSKRFGLRVYLKLECFQPIRVFKIRGAYNKISQLSSKNIVAVSSGNHGMAVAYSSRLLGKKCTVIVPVGGGGLISGISTAIKSLKPDAKVYGVEPQGAPKLQAALKAGKIVTFDSPKSIADGLIPSAVGELTLEACRKYVDGVYNVSDDEILSAMKLLVRDAHIFPEPSGAAPAAVLLANNDLEKLGEKVVLVISGGNVSLDLLAKTITG